jgi:MOSC domain-containing protein YiiM
MDSATAQEPGAAPAAEPVARVAGIFFRKSIPEDLGLMGVPPPPERGAIERHRISAETVVQVCMQGLVGTYQFNNGARFPARGYPVHDGLDRAILVQTSANIEALRAANLELREPIDDKLVPGIFGENVFLEAPGLLPEQVCVGDEFSCWRAGEEQILRLQIASPRNPCGKVDMKLGKTYTMKGVRAHCAPTGLAGFFFRVLHPGDIKEGDVFYLASRPNPTWTLERVSRLLYGHPTANMSYQQRYKMPTKDQITKAVERDEWMGTEEELNELTALPELAVVEYKEHLFNMLGLPGIGRYSQQGPSLRNMVFGSPTLLVGSAMTLIAAGLLVQLSRRSAGRSLGTVP